MDLGLRRDDRILVLGSSGWFGREFHALIEREAQSSTVLEVPGPSSSVQITQEEMVSFSPTVVLNFSFLTREKLEIDGEKTFVSLNSQLTRRFEELASRSTVRLALTVSSGSAVTEPDHPYGKLKASEEARTLELMGAEKQIVIIRAYSVSGGFVRRPRDYAFSDFIVQAAKGAIHVKATSLVYRRYCSVTDALTVALRSAANGLTGVFETGGPRVELGELAQRVSDRLGPGILITRQEIESSTVREYLSDNNSWTKWSIAAGIRPSDLNEQIDQTAGVLLGSL